jgi:hypothetical protein
MSIKMLLNLILSVLVQFIIFKRTSMTIATDKIKIQADYKAHTSGGMLRLEIYGVLSGRIDNDLEDLR